MTEKLILTDADGVLLDWGTTFEAWMNAEGWKIEGRNEASYGLENRFGISRKRADDLVTAFNKSDYMEHLTPWRDAVPYVKRLGDHGYKFVVITSMGSDERAKELRWKNLRNLFGHVFDALHTLDMHQSKSDILSAYGEAIWIEDHPHNANDGLVHGHETYLMDAPYNRIDEVHDEVIRVKDWQELYNHIYTKHIE